MSIEHLGYNELNNDIQGSVGKAQTIVFKGNSRIQNGMKNRILLYSIT